MGKKKKKVKIESIGQTTDDYEVIRNVFNLYETYGIALNIIVSVFKDNNLKVDWIDFYINAYNKNMNPKNIFDRIHEAVREVYGTKYANELITGLKIRIGKE